MPRLPRDVSGESLIRKLKIYGYEVTRQTGSHVRLTRITTVEHHLTIPKHDALRLGTLNSILTDIAQQLGKTKNDVIEELFD